MAKWTFLKPFGLTVAALIWPHLLFAADKFGDISVAANAIYTGNTYHGYAEMRVVLENNSPGSAHSVTLIFPNNSYGAYGNGINRVSRSVRLDAGTREIVSLLLPPLPAQGDGSIRVEVDGHHEGEIHAPNGNLHCNFYNGRGQMATVFVSRNLDYDSVERLFHANSGAFTAAKATGGPDVPGYGNQFNCWVPDNHSYGLTNWLELDYAAPQTVDRVTVYSARSPIGSGFLGLVGVAGTNLAKLPMSSGINRRTSSEWETEFSFPVTSQPVKTVRLDFGSTPPYNIAIDAVEISGPTGSQWASDARASSDNTAAAASLSLSGTAADEITSLRAESPVSEWSENWLAYTPFDIVVLSAGDLGALSPAAFAALGDYLYAGGNIVLLGQSEMPQAWHATRQKGLPQGAEFVVGFGNCFALTTATPSALDPQAVRALRAAVHDSASYWQGLPDAPGPANAALPVIENLKIPTRGIILIMLAFIIVIGPVNMIYLSRRNRRTWMLWTIPAISLVTTLLVFVYSLVREGITPDVRIAGVTLLDQTSHRAATVGGEAFYCPLTPSGGVTFDYETEATPLVHVGYDRSGTPREMDWTQAQHLTHGWVSARVPAHFHVRKTEARRERIQVVSDHGRWKIVNSLGAPIKSIWVADRSLKIYQAENVDAGQMAGLILSPASGTPGKAGADGLLHDISFAAHTDGLAENVGRYLLPGTYIAVLDGNPFLENALGTASNPKRTKSSAVVFGTLESTDLP